MTRADDEILEWLEECGGGTPMAIAKDIDKHNDYISQRCSKLVDLGLLKRPSRGFYVITGEGIGYLAGELDASDLEN